MKKWNWTLGLVVFCMSFFGSLANPNYTSISDALIVGGIMGVIFGIIMAWMFKD